MKNIILPLFFVLFFYYCTVAPEKKQAPLIDMKINSINKYNQAFTNWNEYKQNFFHRIGKQNYNITLNYVNNWFCSKIIDSTEISRLDNQRTQILNINNPNTIRIGNLVIFGWSTCDNLATFTCDIHHISNDFYSFWYPLDWGTYVLQQDTNNTPLFIIDTILNANINITKKINNRILSQTFFYKKTFTIIKNTSDALFSVHSLKQMPFYLNLSNIIQNTGQIQKTGIDSLLQLLQNQGNRSRMHETNYTTIIHWDSLNNKSGHFLRTLIEERVYAYQYVSLENIDTFRFEIIDGTAPYFKAIEEYAKKTQPTLIYLKNCYRNSLSNEPYYYFIFYYIDFLPFMPPRLRDMQVVFPRRFGLS
jgi:hypothetical protein